MASERENVRPTKDDSTLIEYRDGQPVYHHLPMELAVIVAPLFYRRTLGASN